MASETGKRGPDPIFLNPEKRAKFLEAIRDGASLTAGLRHIGVSFSAWQHWRRLAEQGVEPQKAFMDEIHAAEAELEQELARTWVGIARRAAAEGDHKAIMEFMGRRFKQDWSPTYKQEIEANVVSSTLDSQDVLRRLLPELARDHETGETSGDGGGEGSEA